MPKKIDVSSLHQRQNKSIRSQIEMRQRAIDQGATPVMKKSLIAHNLSAQKQLEARRSSAGASSVPTWEQHEGIFNALASGIYQFCDSVKNNLQVVGAAGKADTNFHNIITTTMKDCQTFSERLVEIRTRYKSPTINKTGLVVSDDLDLYYAVGTDYHNLYTQFQSLTFQAGTELTSYLASVDTLVSKDKGLQNVVAKAVGVNPELRTSGYADVESKEPITPIETILTTTPTEQGKS